MSMGLKNKMRTKNHSRDEECPRLQPATLSADQSTLYEYGLQEQVETERARLTSDQKGAGMHLFDSGPRSDSGPAKYAEGAP